MKSVLRRSAAALSVLSILLVGVAGVNAQNNAGNGFRISPVRSEYIIDRGKSDTLTITLENPSNGTVTARPIVNDFVASENEDGEPRLILDDNAPAPRNSFKSLVQDMSDIELGPRERKDIPVTIRIPEDANAGGYYGAVRYLPINDGETQTVGLTASVGTIVLVRVPGNLTERLDLVQLSAGQGNSPKSFLMDGDVQVITRLRNEGDIHVKPFGRIQVKDMFGKVVNEFELNSSEPRANILPDSIRKFTDDQPRMKWFGRYTIEANIGYSQGSGDLITAKSTFWYLPIWSLVLLALIVVGIIGGSYMTYRKYTIRKPKHGVRKKR